MELYFENRSGKDVEIYEEVIGSAAQNTILEEGIPDNIELSITLVGREEIREINGQYRNIDRETDVLSFPMYNFNGDEKELYSNKDNNKNRIFPIGDIVICMDKAEEQANSYEHSIERELGFLTVHSMLHLFGYDHENAEDENIMTEKQEKILNKMGLTRGSSV